MRTLYRRVRLVAIWRRPGLTARGDPDHDHVVAAIVARQVELCKLPHDETAVGAQHLAGHRRRRIRGQVGDGSRGVVGREPPFERLAVDCGVELLVGVQVREPGVSVRPGATADTAMPSAPRVAARVRMIPSSAPLLAM